MSDDSGVFVVVHEQEVEVGDVLNEEFFVAGREEVLGLLVGTITDLWHGELSLEPSSDLYVSGTVQQSPDPDPNNPLRLSSIHYCPAHPPDPTLSSKCPNTS